MLSFSQFKELFAQGYNRIPLVLELFADLDTPLSVYLKLANKPFTFLLESVVGGERFGRYSFIGLACHTYIKVEDKRVRIFENKQCIKDEHMDDPLSFIQQYQDSFKTPEIPNLPRFTGGLVGYFGYETVHHFESKLGKTDKPDPIGTPDICLMLSEELAVIDNLSGKIYLIVYADPNANDGYFTAKNRLESIRLQLRQSFALPLSLGSGQTQAISEYGEEPFRQAVQATKERIFAGDCMQVVLSQRMSMPFTDHPLMLYRSLRSLNPSPYLFYYHFDDFYIIGSSPEILVRREQDIMTVRPLAGTRPRGKNREEDTYLAKELLADPKEIAEHVMLIDLGRNDVGKVSHIGQVEVTEKMVIEKYSHVMHIVSSVEGKLPKNTHNIDVLKSAFPAGTLSGAPKVRAMEIIESLEPSKRGIYGGAVGYLSFNGDMDLAIAIRTAVIKNDTLYIQSGAGIVADSDPQAEWQETQNKARAVIRAAHMVQEGLDK
ncbi:anthranilate synthase component I [Neisseria sp. Ec49-e6-T10]|uniref:anthranilate synthase component I n=1 Tax=Neisseria sp. Ec49-e6-T10 TaxID=3140744 RepID=UPI003EBA45A0